MFRNKRFGNLFLIRKCLILLARLNKDRLKLNVTLFAWAIGRDIRNAWIICHFSIPKRINTNRLHTSRTFRVFSRSSLWEHAENHTVHHFEGTMPCLPTSSNCRHSCQHRMSLLFPRCAEARGLQTERVQDGHVYTCVVQYATCEHADADLNQEWHLAVPF